MLKSLIAELTRSEVETILKSYFSSAFSGYNVVSFDPKLPLRSSLLDNKLDIVFDGYRVEMTPVEHSGKSFASSFDTEFKL